MTKIVVIVFLMLPLVAVAAVQNWKIVPDQSSLTFTGIQNNAPVSGKFKTFSGDIHFNPADLNASSVRIVVNTDSVTMAYQEIADALKTVDWFDVTKYPQAVFESKKFSKTGENAYRSNGILIIRNKTVPISINFKVKQLANDKVEITGSTEVKRSLFGVGQGEWASTDEIKDEVKIDFILTAIKQ